jgi:hypothetical protein
MLRIGIGWLSMAAEPSAEIVPIAASWPPLPSGAIA